MRAAFNEGLGQGGMARCRTGSARPPFGRAVADDLDRRFFLPSTPAS